MKTIDDIDFNAKYEGYLWMSDSANPIVLDNTALDKGLFTTGNPFVVETQLFDGDNKKSVSIKYVDGSYCIGIYDVTDEDSKVENQKFFVANRMGDSRLKFVQHWKEEPDPNCDGMQVYCPSELVFIGFDKTKKEED